MNFLDTIQDKIPNIKKHFDIMANTLQDNIWHGEGDVMTHTMMVLEEVEKLNIPEKNKQILRYVAALHDIGKPNTYSIEDGRIRSHGHNKVGYHIALELLDSTDTEFIDVLEIINLIRYHGKPVWLFESDEPERDVIQRSMECNLMNLYHFARCDNMGRIASDINDNLTKIEYFKEVSESLNCFNNPFNFHNDLLKFKYLINRTHHYNDIPYNDRKSKVWLMSGLPGSGKDTYINKYLSNVEMISLDDIRIKLKIKPTDNQGLVIQTAKDHAKYFLRNGVDFVWNATNISKNTRESLITLFDTYDAHINIIYIHNHLKNIKENNKSREEKKVVPENIIDKMFRKLEIPFNHEAHNVQYISNF